MAGFSDRRSWSRTARSAAAGRPQVLGPAPAIGTTLRQANDGSFSMGALIRSCSAQRGGGRPRSGLTEGASRRRADFGRPAHAAAAQRPLRLGASRRATSPVSLRFTVEEQGVRVFSCCSCSSFNGFSCLGPGVRRDEGTGMGETLFVLNQPRRPFRSPRLALAAVGLVGAHAVCVGGGEVVASPAPRPRRWRAGPGRRVPAR